MPAPKTGAGIWLECESPDALFRSKLFFPINFALFNHFENLLPFFGSKFGLIIGINRNYGIKPQRSLHKTIPINNSLLLGMVYVNICIGLFFFHTINETFNISNGIIKGGRHTVWGG